MSATNSGCGSPIFHGGGPSNAPCWRYALSQSITSDAMAANLLRRCNVPGVHGFVGVHTVAIEPKHLGQRVGSGHSALLQCPHSGDLPGRTVASGLGAALDHAEVPVAHFTRDSPAAQAL